MKIKTSRFGEAEISQSKIISFPDGLPGLEWLKRYVLITPPETTPFHWLQAVDDADIALAVIDPTVIFNDYSPAIPETDLDLLEISKAEDVLILTVCVIPGDFKKMTTNLMSPLLVNVNTNKGKQVILGDEHELRQPIFEAISQYLTGGAGDAGSDSQG